MLPFCGQCGGQVGPGDAFCGSCGAPVELQAQPAAPTPRSAPSRAHARAEVAPSSGWTAWRIAAAAGAAIIGCFGGILVGVSVFMVLREGFHAEVNPNLGADAGAIAGALLGFLIVARRRR